MITDAQFLDLVDAVQTEPGERRYVLLSVGLVGAAFPEHAGDAALLPLGERDRYLLRWRQTRWGNALASVTECPYCGASVEMTLDAALLCALPIGAGGGKVEQDGVCYHFRCPNSYDLLASLGGQSADDTAQTLWHRCVTLQDKEVVPEPTDAAWQAVTGAMEAADPLAAVTLTTVCPACQEEWEAAFDTAAFVGVEVETHTRRLLREVHQLAQAYHWAERDILALSAARRRAYRELLES